MKNALISVSDKTGIVEFAQELVSIGYQIISTGGTFKVLQEAGVKKLIEVADFTGFPEGLEGRIKTLTPQVFGGILNLRHEASHREFCEKNKIENIDLVVVNLYPFKETYYNDAKNFEEKVEQIDIGGPSMIRAAAKNYEFCAPIVDPDDYERVIEEMKTANGVSLELRKELAAKVFEMTAHYDLLIAKFWVENSRKSNLRYGENPHQDAVMLRDPFATGANLVDAELLNGKPMSYNNYQDAGGALELALSFGQPFACIIKHATPCCAAIGDTLEHAWDRAWEAGDQTSAFGGIIALNRTVSKELATKIVSFFNEVVLAPDFDDDALAILKEKKNLRVLRVPNFDDKTVDLALRRVRGGTLVQDLDTFSIDEDSLEFVDEHPAPAQISDLLTAWEIVKIVKSNAIVVVKDGAMIGKGGGQTSRVEACQIAIEAAGDRAEGAVMASDAFFPFDDGVEIAGNAKISAIIQPGGSIRDDEVFATAKNLGINMVLTGARAFLH